jgi:hypothetical protein
MQRAWNHQNTDQVYVLPGREMAKSQTQRGTRSLVLAPQHTIQSPPSLTAIIELDTYPLVLRDSACEVIRRQRTDRGVDICRRMVKNVVSL